MSNGKSSCTAEDIKENTYEKKRTENETLCQQLGNNVTAIAGLREIAFSENGPTRLAWAFLFGFGIACTAFYLYKTTGEYLARPTSTTIVMAPEEKLEFPPLALCPPCWFNTRKAFDLGLSSDSLMFSLSYLDDYFDYQVGNVSAAKDEFISVYKAMKFGSLLDYYKAISNNLVPFYHDENLIHTNWTFHSRRFKSGTKIEKMIVNNRMCYFFQLSPVERLFGVYSGMRLITIRYQDNTLGIGKPQKDWQVFFQQMTGPFFKRSPTKTIPPSYISRVEYTEKIAMILNKKQSPCVDTDQDRNYSAWKCMADCHNELYKNAIGCNLHWLTSTSSYAAPDDTCNFLSILPGKNCTLMEYFDTDENDAIDDTAADVCVKKCPPTCKTIIANIEVWSEKSLADAQKWGMPVYHGEDVRNIQIIQVNVKHAAAYATGVPTLSERYSYSFTQFINNIGGTLGLFIGATAMTLAQMIHTIIRYIGENRRLMVTNEKVRL